MNQLRLDKFNRMLKYQLNRVEMSKQKLALQQHALNDLRQQLAILTYQMEQIQQTCLASATSVSDVQMCDLRMVDTQRELNLKESEIAEAEKKRDDLLTRYRDEERQFKAWEKLTSREAVKLSTAMLMSEQRQADELHLLTKFSGETR